MTSCFNRKAFFAFILFICPLLPSFLKAQVSIVSASINSYNITPRAMAEVGIMNTQQNAQAVLEARLYNSANELLITIKTNPFLIHNGLNMTAALSVSIASTEYGSGNQANYVKSSHTLPSGQFKYCCTLFVNAFDAKEEYCTEVESDLSMFLMLVSPENKDTIDTSYPDLVWNHSQPFNLLASGEFFRMVVVELTSDQTPEAGISVNVPIMTKDYLHDHNVLYPFSAKALEPGKRYGWQVQVLTNGVITNKTEAWEFTPRVPKSTRDNKYATLKQTLDGSFYTTENNKLFFRFDEAYSSNVLACKIYDSQMQPIKYKVSNEGKKGADISLKSSGYNRFELNLDQFDVNAGFYSLEVKNEKGEVFMLRILVK